MATPPTTARARGSVAVVIPARNEAPTLADVIERARPWCDELVVVDGHSRDDTALIARRLGARVVQDQGRGKGDALRVGVAEVSSDIAVFIDADGSHDPGDIPRLVKPITLGRADLVIGSRGRGGSDELHGTPEKLLRLIGSQIVMIAINMRWHQELTDSQNGLRAIRTETFRALKLKEDITTIEQEMLMRCLRLGYKVEEIPTHEYARKYGESVIVLRKVWLRYIYVLIKNLLF